jgi:hypothetical protein
MLSWYYLIKVEAMYEKVISRENNKQNFGLRLKVGNTDLEFDI